jgi:multiple antibiotic resistance protein
MDIELLIYATVAIIVVTDPFGNVPLFLALTDGFTEKDRKKIITKASVTALLILLLFALVGEYILQYLKVHISSLKIAGGLLLLVIAYDMMLGQSRRYSPVELEDRKGVAITPMATPLIAGPGAMTTVMIYMTAATTTYQKLLIIAAIVIAMLLFWAITINSDLVYRAVKKDGARALTKIMGIVLAAIAIEMVISGVKAAFGI